MYNNSHGIGNSAYQRTRLIGISRLSNNRHVDLFSKYFAFIYDECGGRWDGDVLRIVSMQRLATLADDAAANASFINKNSFDYMYPFIFGTWSLNNTERDDLVIQAPTASTIQLAHTSVGSLATSQPFIPISDFDEHLYVCV